MRCEEYLKEQRRIIANVVKKTLDKCVEDIIKSTKQVIDKNKQRLTKLEVKDTQTMDNVKVPIKYKKQIEDYVDFLSSKSN